MNVVKCDYMCMCIKVLCMVSVSITWTYMYILLCVNVYVALYLVLAQCWLFQTVYTVTLRYWRMSLSNRLVCFCNFYLKTTATQMDMPKKLILTLWNSSKNIFVISSFAFVFINIYIQLWVFLLRKTVNLWRK